MGATGGYIEPQDGKSLPLLPSGGLRSADVQRIGAKNLKLLAALAKRKDEEDAA